jgi:hypothetical protein
MVLKMHGSVKTDMKWPGSYCMTFHDLETLCIVWLRSFLGRFGVIVRCFSEFIELFRPTQASMRGKGP